MFGTGLKPMGMSRLMTIGPTLLQIHIVSMRRSTWSAGAYQFVDFEVTCFTVTGNNNGGGDGTPDPCGLNSSYTLIMSWSDAQTYNYGDSQNISFYVNCTRTGEAYTLEYYVYDITNSANYVASGSYSWTASGVWHSWSDDVYGLNPGDYCVHQPPPSR